MRLSAALVHRALVHGTVICRLTSIRVLYRWSKQPCGNARQMLRKLSIVLYFLVKSCRLLSSDFVSLFSKYEKKIAYVDKIFCAFLNICFPYPFFKKVCICVLQSARLSTNNVRNWRDAICKWISAGAYSVYRLNSWSES